MNTNRDELIAGRGPTEPICEPMPDGYWTPRHLAQQEIECLTARIAELESSQAWRPIESAPRDGTTILIARIDRGVVHDVLNGRFEVLIEDEEDGPWDIRDGEPWCSYEGRAAGIYFCHWLPEAEWESRWRFGPSSGYTHWMPLPQPPQDAEHE